MESPDWVRRVNYMGSAVGAAENMVGLDPDELLTIASKSTNLSDFGDDDWQPAYRRLLDSIEEEGRLTTLGRLMTRADILRALRNRLWIVEALKKTPEIRQQSIEAPVVIIGQGRTGSTISFELLNLDGKNRAPLAWEGEVPVEPPQNSLGNGISAREIAQLDNEFWADVQPAVLASHEHRWDLPVECPRLMTMDFTSDYWPTAHSAGSFNLWRHETDPDSAFDWHKLVLQTLQQRRPHEPSGQRWLLKCPGHIRVMDKLMQRYPDLRVICTHRDPVKTVPSTMSLMCNIRGMREDPVDREGLAQGILYAYENGMRKIMAERESGIIPASQVTDIHFQNLMTDPVGSISRAYSNLGLSFSDRHAEQISTYLAEKPRNKFGRHRYSAQDFGMSVGQIREQFKFYTDHFDIALEDE